MADEAVTVPGEQIMKDEPAKPTTQPNLNVVGGNTMPKGQKGPTTAKSVYVKFTEPADLELYDRLEADAKAKRYDLGTYILLVLLEAYAPANPTSNS